MTYERKLTNAEAKELITAIDNYHEPVSHWEAGFISSLMEQVIDLGFPLSLRQSEKLIEIADQLGV